MIATGHPGNVAPMKANPRCGAKTRKGTPCHAPAVRGKARCSMHGGAKRSGVPQGKQNALKHGLTTAEARASNAYVRHVLKTAREHLE